MPKARKDSPNFAEKDPALQEQRTVKLC